MTRHFTYNISYNLNYLCTDIDVLNAICIIYIINQFHYIMTMYIVNKYGSVIIRQAVVGVFNFCSGYCDLVW